MPKESAAARKARAAKALAILDKAYPNAKTALDFAGPLQMLVATILSAQCTDKRVNLVTPALFKKYKSAADFAAAGAGVLEQEIRSTGFYRNKAKSIRGACRRIVEQFGGKVPDTMEALLTLPGVARKTANVVLGAAFGKAEGVVVDTHIRRVTGRLGFTRHTDPVRIEQDLMTLFPLGQWKLLGDVLVLHGRAICQARKPKCAECPVSKLCPSAFTFE